MTKSTNKTKTAEGVRKASEKVGEIKLTKVEYRPSPMVNTHKPAEEWKELGFDLCIKIRDLQRELETFTDVHISADHRRDLISMAYDVIEKVKIVVCCDIVKFDKLCEPNSILGKASMMVMEDVCLTANKFIDELIKIPTFEKQATELLQWCENQLAR